MLVVTTYIDKRKDGNMGLFAGNTILKNEKVIKSGCALDRWFYHQQIINDNFLNFFCRYAIFYEEKGMWKLFGDDARFIGHSVHNNIEQRGQHFYANDKIISGEEITLNYLVLCDWVKTHGLKHRKNPYTMA